VSNTVSAATDSQSFSVSVRDKNVVRKCAWRLIPFLFLLLVVAMIDRVNVGFAALQMNRDLGFSALVFGFGAGIFYLGYALFEVPSNLFLARIGARVWIARIMLTWGLVSVAMIFVRGPWSFYTLRFLLGLAEAGFLPGIVYYLSQWFPRTERASVMSWFMAAIPVSVVIGGPLAGLLLQMNGVLGLRGWQWLFLLEGAPAALLGGVVPFLLADSPDKASWLEPEERAALSARIRDEQAQAVAHHGFDLRRALLHPTIWRLGLIYSAVFAGSTGLTFWLPQIIKHMSASGDLQVGLISAIPYAAAAVAMVLVGWSSDRTGERFLHLAGPCALGAVGFVASLYVSTPVAAVLALTAAAIGDFASRGPFWALPGRFLAGNASAAGIALINSLGALGGFIGPYAIGLAKQATGEFSAGLVLMAALMLLAALATLGLRSAPTMAIAAAPTPQGRG
jgi:ACS family tartrate transporter-like MFS transporter